MACSTNVTRAPFSNVFLRWSYVLIADSGFLPASFFRGCPDTLVAFFRRTEYGLRRSPGGNLSVSSQGEELLQARQEPCLFCRESRRKLWSDQSFTHRYNKQVLGTCYDQASFQVLGVQQYTTPHP